MRRFKAEEIQEIIEILKKDGVISVPTDTVYGVCSQVSSHQAEENLRNVKHRPLTKAFPVMCADLEQIQEIAEVDDRAKKVIEGFMPGPITVILKRKDGVNLSQENLDTIAIRMATSDTLAKIIKGLGRPIFMIEKSCPDLDGMLEGDVSFGEASTIVDCTKEDLVILRQGPITMQDITEKLSK